MRLGIFKPTRPWLLEYNPHPTLLRPFSKFCEYDSAAHIHELQIDRGVQNAYNLLLQCLIRAVDLITAHNQKDCPIILTEGNGICGVRLLVFIM